MIANHLFADKYKEDKELAVQMNGRSILRIYYHSKYCTKLLQGRIGFFERLTLHIGYDFNRCDDTCVDAMIRDDVGDGGILH